jgi:hypothetical protein
MPVELMPLYVSPGLARTGAGMPVAPSLAGSSTSFLSSTGTNSYTITHTVPADANCLALYVGNANNWLDIITAVSWDGVEMGGALIHAFSQHAPVGPSAASIWALANPAIGTHDIVIELLDCDSLACCIVNLAGVDTTAPTVQTFEQEIFGSEAPPTAIYGGNLVTATPSLIFGGIVLPRPAGAASFTPDSGVVELIDGTASGDAASRHFAGWRREIAGTHRFGATCTQSGYGAAAAVAFRGM